MLVLRLVLRGLRWRAAASITVFLVAMIAVLSATVGPIYLHATDQVVLTERLQHSARPQRDVVITRDTLVRVPGQDWREPVARFARQAADPRWFGAPVFVERAVTTVSAPNKLRFDTRLLAIDGQCQHLTFTAGTCPQTDKQTALSARAAASGGWHVGDRVTHIAGNVNVPLTISGIYQPLDPQGDYWSAWTFFDAAPQLYDSALPRLDSFFVLTSTLSARVLTVPQTFEANVALLPAHVGLDDRNALRASVRAVEQQVNADVPAEAISLTKIQTQLVPILDSLDRELSLSATLVTLATAQLAVLAICVLYAIVAATASVRGPEVALAKLRGRRPWKILAQALLEPSVLVLSAAVAGAALAWMAVRLAAPRLLGTHATVSFPASALAVAAISAVAALLAAMVAARRIVASPVAALLRRGGDASASSAGLAVADAVAVALALAGLVELSVGGVLTAGKPDPLSVLAPVLLAVAVAIVGLRLLPFAGRAVLGWTRESRRLVGYLAVRQIVRRSAGTRLVLLISVALALATFAVTNWSVAKSNRHLRALNETGAVRVLTVDPATGVDLLTAVARADPGGRQAMAAVVIDIGNSTPLLALDTTRMTGIAAWRPDYSALSQKQIIASLRPRTAPPVLLTGQEVRLDITLTKVVPANDLVAATITVSDPEHRESVLDLGTLRPGRGRYRAALSPDCVRGCRVIRIAVAPLHPAPVPVYVDGTQQPVRGPSPEIDVQVHGMDVADTASGPWRPVDAGLGDAGRWRARGDHVGTLGVASAGGSLEVSFAPLPSDDRWPSVDVDDVPDHVPAVLGPQTASVYPGKTAADASTTGLDGQPVALNGSVKALTLPQFDRIGAMVDLTLAQRAMTQTALAGARYQVWLAPAAPAGLTARLEAQGLHVVATERAATNLAALNRTGPAFADNLFVIAAGAATILAIGATVLGGLVTARRRSYELAALEAVGVAPRTLRWATAAEQGLLLAVGLVLGVLAGIGGAVLALPSTPFFVSTDEGPPVEDRLPGVTLGVLCAGLVVILALTCLAVARLVEGQATAGRLRESQQ